MVEEVKEVKSSLDSFSTFIHESKTEGIWYAFTGEHFLDTLKNLALTIVHYSDYLALVALLFGILTMLGSNRSRGWLYWTFILYICLKFVGILL